jgi:membrane protein DedA with SNARE-associated domain
MDGIPFAADLGRGLHGVALAVADWREPLLAAILVAESIPIIGFAAPGLTVLVAAGFLAAQLPAAEAARLALTAFAAIFLADLAMFAAGRFGTAKIPLLARWVGPDGALARGLAAQPPSILIFYQFPPYSRMFAPLLFGAGRHPWSRWTGLSAAATGLFVAACFGGGLAAALSARSLAGAISGAGTIAVVFSAGLIGWLGTCLWRWWRMGRETGSGG